MEAQLVNETNKPALTFQQMERGQLGEIVSLGYCHHIVYKVHSDLVIDLTTGDFWIEIETNKLEVRLLACDEQVLLTQTNGE